MSTTALNCGRRASDQWLARVLVGVMQNVRPNVKTPLLTEPLVKKTRRPRRSNKQLANALKLALDNVRAAHPDWLPARIKRTARHMVRTYQVVG